MRLKKIVKLTDHTCACNDLTNFECGAQVTRNGSLCQFAATCMEKLVKSLVVNLFLAGFSLLEPLCVVAAM